MLRDSHFKMAGRLFAGSPVSTRMVGEQIGQASAFKMCAGLRSKVIPAVWATLIDAAKAFGPHVEESVRDHLADIGQDMSEQEAKIAERAPEEWRWTAEMAEFAKAMAEVGSFVRAVRGGGVVFGGVVAVTAP